MKALHHIDISKLNSDAAAALHGRISPYLDWASALGLYFTALDLLDAGVSVETVGRLFRDEHVVDRPVIEVEPGALRTSSLLGLLDCLLDEVADLRNRVVLLADHEGRADVVQVDHESSSCGSRSCCHTPGVLVTVEVGADTPPSAVAAAVQASLARRTAAPKARPTDDLGLGDLRHCGLPCCNLDEDGA